MSTVERALYAAVLLGVLVAGWARRWTSDDAFINFRVVENLLAGNGPVFSAGERTEVATSAAWLAVLTVAEAVVPGDAVAWSSVVLGLALTATGVLFAMLGARRLFAGTAARLSVPFGAVVFLALPPAWDFTTSGLETGMSFAWLGTSFWALVRWMQSGQRCAGRPLWLFVLLGLGPLVRPDFALVAGILLLWLTVASVGPWWRRLLGLFAAGVLPVAYQVFRMGYYGLLVPNTAVAKESSRPLWGRGTDYLVDLVGPHLLWVPGLLLVAMLVALLPALTWRALEWSLVAAVLLAAAAHALYVVRVGGDFMHGRLLMPSLFLLLCPLAAVPLTRARVWVGAALLTATGVWAVVSAAALRTGYEGGISAGGISDERGFYAGLAGVGHPVTIEDHGGAGVANYVDRVNRLADDGEDLVVLQVTPVRPDTDLDVLAPSARGVVFSVGNAGFYGYASDLDVFVLDGLGLTDAVNSHIEAGPPGRPGHEKVYPSWYLLARYGSPEIAERQFEGLPSDAMVAASRAALSCGDLAELVEATTGPLTWERFTDNLVGAPDRTSLRIPTDPFAAEREFC
ncbi:arabinofuranosyltransferase [Blastococcus aurantiacus]|uniref:Arabinofuranosyltransferase n=2 Tax=Blastococcus aurantiacus TaxID=1550231 RepID=A0A1G7KZR4_9ACTN|nr:arabinofuranosyltransferase [Blastococcus aurantiacus]